ncbi:hypothetical protein HanIR_Chr12g0585211 [Helianthus annuus]|nr:hypothetical protein HanIR_Chr12g0585211 [Helianthus annuus]
MEPCSMKTYQTHWSFIVSRTTIIYTRRTWCSNLLINNNSLADSQVEDLQNRAVI